MSLASAFGAAVIAMALTGCNGNGGLTPVDDSGGEDTDVEDLIGILVTPEKVTVPVGEAIQLGATGLLENRSSRDMTNVATWTSADSAIAAVSDGLDQEGLVSGVAVGTAEVWAEVGGIRSPSIKVKVTDAELVGLTVEPKQVDLEVGKGLELKASAAFSDGSRSDASSQVRWITGDGAVAQIASGGRLTAAGVGSTTVHADWNGTLSGEIAVNVVSAANPDLRVLQVKGESNASSLTLTVTVENVGNVGASDFWVDAFVDPASSPPAAGDFGDDFMHVGYVGAKSTAQVTFTFDGLATGAHDVYVVIDTDDAVAETDEGNNGFGTSVSIADDTPSGPNLSVQYFDFIADDEHIYYFIDVYNSGSEDVEAFYVDLYVDRSDAPAPETDGDEYVRVNELARGATESADFLIERVCSGCTSWLFVDSYNYISETDEDDNYAGPVTVSNP